MTELKYEAFLSRIEVIRGRADDLAETPAEWEVTLQIMGEFGLLTGVLRTHTDSGMGQALVHGALIPSPSGEPIPDIEIVKTSLAASGCIEAMYDLARRSVSMQAAAMDFTFDLATKAPDVQIDTKVTTEHSEHQPS